MRFLKPQPIEQLTQDDLYEARRSLLIAEANLEQASADVAKYRNRVRRLEQSLTVSKLTKFPEVAHA